MKIFEPNTPSVHFRYSDWGTRKGAAIGASRGAGAGALGEILAKGGSIKILAESVLTFKL